MHKTKRPEAHNRRFLLVFAANASIVLLLAILVITFIVDAQTSYNDESQGGLSSGEVVDLQPDDIYNPLSLARYPAVLNDRNDYKTTLAGAVVSMTLAISLVWLCVFIHRRGKGLLVSHCSPLPLHGRCSPSKADHCQLTWLSAAFELAKTRALPHLGRELWPVHRRFHDQPRAPCSIQPLRSSIPGSAFE